MDNSTASRMLLKPKRQEDETQEQYRERRKFVNFSIKQHLKGKLVWDSSEQGTFKWKDYEATVGQEQGA